MGDRTYVALQISGHFATRAAVRDVAEALADEYMHMEDDEGSSIGDADAHEASIFDAFDKNVPLLNYWAEEVNYGSIDEIESACQEHGLAYAFTWDAGGSYAAGCAAFYPGDGRFEAGWDGDEPLLTLGQLKEARSMIAIEALVSTTQSAAAEVLESLIKTAEKAAGKTLPPLTGDAGMREAWLAENDAA